MCESPPVSEYGNSSPGLVRLSVMLDRNSPFLSGLPQGDPLEEVYSTAVLRKLVEELPVCFVVWQMEDTASPVSAFKCIAANNNLKKSAGRALGQPMDFDWRGKTMGEVFPDSASDPALSAVYKEVATTQEARTTSFTLPDGTICLLRIFSLPCNCIGVAWDDHAPIEAAECKIVPDELIDEAITVITDGDDTDHELKTIVNNLISFVYGAQSPDVALTDEPSPNSARRADINSVVSNLATTNRDAMEHIDSFLASYRYFITPSALLSKLILKFVAAEGLSSTADKQIQQLRVINVLRKWIDGHWYDFEDEHMKTKLTRFINTSLKTSMPQWSETLSTKISDKEKEREKQQSDDTEKEAKAVARRSPSFGPIIGTNIVNPQPIVPGAKNNAPVAKFMNAFGTFFAPPKSTIHASGEGPSGDTVSFVGLDADEVAQQLCLLNQGVFLHVHAIEFYRQAWTKQDKQNKAPNITQMIENFNRVVAWTTTQVLSALDIQGRAEAIKKFIRIAYHCVKYHNYESFFAIALALKQHVITRLVHTWKKVGSVKKWKKIETLADSAKNYKFYRETVFKQLNTPIPKEKQARDPIVPYFGLYLKDITFIDDGNPNSFDNGLINYDKMKLVASVITQIQQLQTQCGKYKFQPIPLVQDYLLDKAYAVTDEEEWYNMSIKCEPVKPM